MFGHEINQQYSPVFVIEWINGMIEQPCPDISVDTISKLRPIYLDMRILCVLLML